MTDLNLHVETFGAEDAPRVVMLHGSGAPPESMRPWAEALASDYRVFLPHRNGYDATPAHPWDPQAEVATLAELLGEKAAVVGHSFGSYRAFELAARAPDRVSKVIAFGPVAGLPEEARPAVEGLVAFIRSGADLSEAAAARWAAPDYLAAHPGFVERCRTWLARVDAELMAQENLQILDEGAVMKALVEAQPQLHLYVGSEDQATPPALAHAIAEGIPTTTVEVVNGMGHSPMIERFDDSLAWLRSRLAT